MFREGDLLGTLAWECCKSAESERVNLHVGPQAGVGMVVDDQIAAGAAGNGPERRQRRGVRHTGAPYCSARCRRDTIPDR